MSKTKKSIIAILIVVVILATIYFVIRKYLPAAMGGVPKGFIKSYAKKKNDWVAQNVGEFDNDWYQGQNSKGSIIYFKKSDVTLENNPKNEGKSAYATKDFNVFYKNMT